MRASFNFAVLISVIALTLTVPVAQAQLFSIKTLTGVDFTAKTHFNAPKALNRDGTLVLTRSATANCSASTGILRLFPKLPQCPALPPKPTPTRPATTSTPTSTATGAPGESTTSSQGGSEPTTTTAAPEPSPTVPADGYTATFLDLHGATQADGYLTFGLVDTVDECKAMCNSVAGCVFLNTYNDVKGKDGSPQLTCSLFSICHDASTATNRGGFSQPDGSVNHIENSSGWCKA